MELILLIGVQASGKSTFCHQRFLNSHVRISLDLLNTRYKEQQFLDTCFAVQQKIVVDNTNTTREERNRYIEQAKRSKYKVIGYFFETDFESAMARNALRTGKSFIPEVGIKSAFKRLQQPVWDEGFDRLYTVKLQDTTFAIHQQHHEI